MRIILAVIALLIATAVAAVFAGSSSWNRATRAAVATLSAVPGGAAAYSIVDLADLPELAARYFRRVLRDGQPRVRSAIATQEAEFFLNGAWRPLRSTQHFVSSPPGFVWDARIGMAPLVSAYVRDSYVAGTGTMTASTLGVYLIVNPRWRGSLEAAPSRTGVAGSPRSHIVTTD